MICDVASSQGQRSEQSFFRVQAQVQMEFAFRVLEAAQFAVTLENAYELVTSEKLLKEVMDLLSANESPAVKTLAEHYQSNFVAQPTEQLGGVKTTVANYLKYFTDPDIAAVFCPKKSTFRMSDIDRGKVVCVSIPQRFQVERRYVNTLLKLVFYSHVLRRFDEPADVRARHNLALCCADEAPRTLTASHDGMSDYNVVDVIRQARATFLAAAQTYTSLIPPMDDERKARVFIANMANRITFKAADEESAKIAADTLGKRRVKKRTYGYSGGRSTSSWTEEERYYIEPHELRRLRKFQAVVQHCERGFRKVTLPPLGPDGKVPAWY
jgi:type IV secretory pathway TraG/TraD family ATPase VirD4